MATEAQAHRPGETWHRRVFFGLHFDLHPNEHDTELGAGTTVAHIRAELEKVRPDWVMYDCKGVPGYAGYPTQVGIPSPGIARDALKVWRKVTRDMGIPLSVHYCGLWDDACWQRHPDWAARKPDGTRYGDDKFDGWHAHPMAIDGPYADQVLIPQLIEVIDRYDVDGVWVDADAWSAVPDWDPARMPPAAEAADLHAYSRRRYAAYLTRYCDALHARKPGFAVCANWAYSARMPDEITTPVDYLSGDYTWTFAADSICLEAKAFDGRGLPWDLMGWGFTTAGPMSAAQWTTRSAAELQMEGALVMSNGGAFWIYDTPVRNGRLVDWHLDVFAEVGRFLRRRQAVFQGTSSAPHVALLHSQSHFYADSAQRGPGPIHSGDKALRTITGALQLLLQNHYHADVLNEDCLLRRLDEYPVVVIAEQTHLPPAFKEAVLAWVRRGGKLLLTGSHIVADWGGVLGVTDGQADEGTGDADSTQPGEPPARYVPADGGAVPIRGPWRLVRPAGARVLAPLLTTQEVTRGQLPHPAATLKRVGKGMIAAIYGPVAAMYADYRYPRIRAFAGGVLKVLTGLMPVEVDAPAHVVMTVRRQPGRTIVHLVNTASTNPLSPACPCMEDVPTAGPITVRAQCARRPKAVGLVPEGARSGLEWKWRAGTLTAVIPALRIHAALVIEEA